MFKSRHAALLRDCLYPPARPSSSRFWLARRRPSPLFQPAAGLRSPPVSAAPDRPSVHVSHARGVTSSQCDHRLRGSASPVLTATGFVNGKGQFSTPHRIDTPQPITKKFVTGDYVGDPYGCAKLGAYPSTGGFLAHG